VIDFNEWIGSVRFAPRPWLVLGKGPTFARRGEFDLSGYHLLSLNHAVREVKVQIAHMIDADVAEACGEALLTNADWVVMPRHPHIQNRPDPAQPLEKILERSPILRRADQAGKLVAYPLDYVRHDNAPRAPGVKVRFFSSEAALGVLGEMGVKTIRSLGVDGGRQYSQDFADLAGQTRLANGQPSFDLQFGEIRRIVAARGLDYAPLVEPMRVFVGADRSQMVPACVLEYSIRKFATGPVEVTPMVDIPVPIPKEPRNRPRTGFSFSRFLIPKLCGYRGRALYVDSDMQVFTDLAELWRIPFGDQKVLCTNQPRPPQWNDNHGFQPGRQMSVMLLDCSRLDWDIERIVQGLDQGSFTYENLMFDMCLLQPHEIEDRIPPRWNCLEHYEPGDTSLLHFTVVNTQPWRNDLSPLRGVWEECYREAMAAGAVVPDEVQAGIAARWLKPALAEALALHPSRRKKAAPATAVATPPAGSAPVRGIGRAMNLVRRMLRGSGAE
jgi:hypothetical protein